MEDAAKIPGIKKIDLVHVQRVRLSLGVTTLADISSSAGTALCEWALNVTTIRDNRYYASLARNAHERQL
jgi:hypothetical protein